MWPVLLHQPRRRLEHGRDGGLVVCAQDRPGGVAHEPVLSDDGLDRRLRQHRVEMGAEEERRTGLGVLRLDPAENVAHRRADPPADIVLVCLEPERAQVVEHAVGDGPLLPRGARERGQLEEE